MVSDSLWICYSARYLTDSVDLRCINSPFNSKRNYLQIFNNQGSEDRAQAQAVVVISKKIDNRDRLSYDANNRTSHASATVCAPGGSFFMFLLDAGGSK